MHLWQFLLYYNALDTKPLCIALTKFISEFQSEFKVDLFERVTIPSLAFPLLMKELEKLTDMRENFFTLLDRNTDNYICKAIQGGLCHLFQRLMIASHTKLNESMHGQNAEIVQKIIGYDANMLYAGVIGKLCCQTLGNYAQHTRENKFRLEKVSAKLKEALQWLLWVSRVEEKKYMQTVLTIGG